MKKYLPPFLALLILCAPLASCSSGQEDKEKGAIERGTDKVAHEAIQMIKTPLDQAKLAAEQENRHTEQVKEQVQKQ